jgi:hypothetical protein
MHVLKEMLSPKVDRYPFRRLVAPFFCDVICVVSLLTSELNNEAT